MHTCISINIYIPKYNIVNLYTVICIYVFMTDRLAIGVLYPEDDYFSYSQLSLVACS